MKKFVTRVQLMLSCRPDAGRSPHLMAKKYFSRKARKKTGIATPTRLVTIPALSTALPRRLAAT